MRYWYNINNLKVPRVICSIEINKYIYPLDVVARLRKYVRRYTAYTALCKKQ